MIEEIKNHESELGEMQIGINCHSEIYLAMQVGLSTNQINCTSRGGSTGLGPICSTDTMFTMIPKSAGDR